MYRIRMYKYERLPIAAQNMFIQVQNTITPRAQQWYVNV